MRLLDRTSKRGVQAPALKEAGGRHKKSKKLDEAGFQRGHVACLELDCALGLVVKRTLPTERMIASLSLPVRTTKELPQRLDDLRAGNIYCPAL